MSSARIDIHSDKFKFRVHRMEADDTRRRFFAIEIEHDCGSVCLFRNDISEEVAAALDGLEV